MYNAFLHIGLQRPIALIYWSKYPGHKWLYYRIQLILRGTHALVHMLFLSILNKMHVEFLGSEFINNFWEFQFYLATLFLYSFSVGAFISLREATLSLNKIKKYSVGFFLVILPIILVIILSKVINILFDNTVAFAQLGILVNGTLIIISYYNSKIFIHQSEDI